MLITAKFPGHCQKCGRHIAVGEKIGWEPGKRGTYCLTCTPQNVASPPIAKPVSSRPPGAPHRIPYGKPTPPPSGKWDEDDDDDSNVGGWPPPKAATPPPAARRPFFTAKNPPPSSIPQPDPWDPYANSVRYIALERVPSASDPGTYRTVYRDTLAPDVKKSIVCNCPGFQNRWSCRHANAYMAARASIYNPPQPPPYVPPPVAPPPPPPPPPPPRQTYVVQDSVIDQIKATIAGSVKNAKPKVAPPQSPWSSYMDDEATEPSPPPPPPPPVSVTYKKTPASWFKVLEDLEEVIVDRLLKGESPELKKAMAQYEAIKGHAVSNPNEFESRNALKQAILAAVKIGFD